MTVDQIELVYDRECPVCDAYCRMVKMHLPPGTVRLVNARERTALLEEITAAGLDIDQGMVVRIGGTLHYGAQAIEALARANGTSGLFGRMNRWLFASSRRSRILYPPLRSFRNLLLKALRKTKVNNLQLANNNRF